MSRLFGFLLVFAITGLFLIRLSMASLTLEQFHPGSDSGREQHVRDAAQLECGPSCLRFLADRLGWRSRYSRVPEPFCQHPLGWSLQDLSDSAKAMGWSAQGRVAQWQAVSDIAGLRSQAAVLHVNGNHFLLIFSQSPSELLLFDPATGQVSAIESLPWHYRWDGVMLSLCCSM